MLRLLLLLLLTHGLWAQVKSTTGELSFDSQGDGLAEATLNAQGFGIGVTTPSANLEVAGNAFVTQAISIGSGTQGSSNLSLTGSVGFSTQSVSSNILLGASSMVLVDSSSGNLTLNLPNPVSHEGTQFTIKKTSTSHEVVISGNGALVDRSTDWALTSGNMGYLKLVAAAGNWSLLSVSEATNSIHSSNLMFHYTFDETNTDTVKDHSANGLNLTRSGFGTSGNGWVNGVIGGALEFDGTDDVATLAHHSKFDNSPMTVSGWIYPHKLASTYGNDMWIYRKRHIGTPWRSYEVFLNTEDDKLFFRWYDNNAVLEVTVKSSAAISTNQWIFFAASVSPTTATLYINGAQQDVDSSVGSGVIYPSDNEFSLGKSDTHYFDGVVDDMRLYNRVLTADEVLSLYQLGSL